MTRTKSKLLFFKKFKVKKLVALQPQQLRQVVAEGGGYGVESRWGVGCGGVGGGEFAVEGGDAFVGEAAGVDGREPGEVGRYVEGETVHCYEAGATQTYGAYFAFCRGAAAYPYACRAVDASGLYAIFADCPYYCLFQQVYVGLYAHAAALQVDYRIDNKLSRAVESDIASAVYLHYLGAACREPFAPQHIARVGMASERVDGLMGHRDEIIVTRGHSVAAQCDTAVEDVVLHVEHLAVGSVAQVDKLCHKPVAV